MSLFGIDLNTPYYRYSTRQFSQEKPDITLIQTWIENLIPLFPSKRFEVLILDKTQTAENSKKNFFGILGKVEAPVYVGIFTAEKEQEDLLQGGFLAEQLVLKATEMNIQSCYLGSSIKKESFLDAGFSVENLNWVITVAFGKESFSKKQIERNRKSRSELCAFGTQSLQEEYDTSMESIRQAPSALNGQPYFFVLKEERLYCYLQESLKAKLSREYRLLRYVDLGIAVFHFMLSRNKKLYLEYLDPMLDRRETYVFSLKLDREQNA